MLLFVAQSEVNGTKPKSALHIIHIHVFILCCILIIYVHIQKFLLSIYSSIICYTLIMLLPTLIFVFLIVKFAEVT